jgi:hypothetical protein
LLMVTVCHSCQCFQIGFKLMRLRPRACKMMRLRLQYILLFKL